jgi:hypothetical protein
MKTWLLFLCIGVLYGADILRTLSLLRRQRTDVPERAEGERLPSTLFRCAQVLCLTALLLVLQPGDIAEHFWKTPILCASALALVLQALLAFRLVRASGSLEAPTVERYTFPHNPRFEEEWTKDPQYIDLCGMRLRKVELPDWQLNEYGFNSTQIVIEGVMILSSLSGIVTWIRASKAFDISLHIYEEMGFKREWAKLVSDSREIASTTAEAQKGSVKRYSELIERMQCFLVVGTMTKISTKLAQPFAPAVYQHVRIFDNSEEAILGALQGFTPNGKENGSRKAAPAETSKALALSYQEQRIMEIYTMLAKISDSEPNSIAIPDVPPEDIYFDVFRAMSVVNDDKRRQMDALVSQQEMLQKQAAEIQEANTMLSERLQQLDEKNRQLESLNNEKNELMGIVSHDLKNPIGAVRGYAELIENQFFTGDDVFTASSQIVQVSDRMLELVKNLLDMNQLESGGMQLNMVSFDISPVVESVVDQYRTTAEYCLRRRAGTDAGLGQSCV